jgi:hypothetical protein
VFGHGIDRARDGTYRIRLRREERELLAGLPAQLDDAIDGRDPSLRRLFPPGYEDGEEEAEYRHLVGAGLLEEKRAALRALADTAHAERLDEAGLAAWLGGLESLRLVLGTELDVTEETYAEGIDPQDADAPRLALYHWLSWLQEEVVQALASGLGRGS